jgi:hypothetical protein
LKIFFSHALLKKPTSTCIILLLNFGLIKNSIGYIRNSIDVVGVGAFQTFCMFRVSLLWYYIPRYRVVIWCFKVFIIVLELLILLRYNIVYNK